MTVVDLFSGGAGGWCLAARRLGMPSVGIELDPSACTTRAAAGYLTIRADVAAYPPERFAGKVTGLCGGPPCQSFSSAGKGKGLADPRGQLVHEPMRWVRVVRPRWVALEQVPEVLGYWRWIGRELRDLGYSVWTGILNAADYGVPQVRKRAILLASLDCRAQPPAPTHSRTGHSDLFGDGLRRWVTMAESLGWDGLLDRRQSEGAGCLLVSAGLPSPTVTGVRSQWVLRSPGRAYDAPSRRGDPLTEPAPCVALGHNASAWCWERPATTVQGDPRIAPPGHHEHNRDGTGVSVQPWELGVLQGFPPDFPWQAPNVSRQIGNAIPPPLAEACLRAVA